MKKIILLALAMLSVFFTQISFADAKGYRTQLIKGTSLATMRSASLEPTDIPIINFTRQTIYATVPGAVGIAIGAGDTGVIKYDRPSYLNIVLQDDTPQHFVFFNSTVCNYAIITVTETANGGRNTNVNNTYCTI